MSSLGLCCNYSEAQQCVVAHGAALGVGEPKDGEMHERQCDPTKAPEQLQPAPPVDSRLGAFSRPPTSPCNTDRGWPPAHPSTTCTGTRPLLRAAAPACPAAGELPGGLDAPEEGWLVGECLPNRLALEAPGNVVVVGVVPVAAAALREA